MSTQHRTSDARPTPLDAPAFLPHACRQLQAPFSLRVLLATQNEYVSKIDDKTKKGPRGKSCVIQQTSRTQHDSQDKDNESSSPIAATYVDPDEIAFTAVLDVAGRLVELAFNKCRELPRLLLKVIGICAPYQPVLSKLTINWVPLEGDAVYEIAKIIPLSQLTEINLDDSPVPERNYCLLFEHSQVRSLSLARCDIDDDDCVTIASKLVHPLPAAKGLLVLSLVSNNISDVGACALGEALRSNRSLQHLNLSGNQVTDSGATHIFRSLMEFFLTYSELITKRQRLMDYSKMRREVFDKCLNELTTTMQDKSHEEFSRISKRKTTSVRSKKSSVTSLAYSGRPSTLDTVAFRAEMMTNELIGSYSDPFSIEETESRDKCVYSLGNTTLCYLNLSYNNLAYASVVTLVEVLQYQSVMAVKSGSGLIRVVIEGNDIPVACKEYSMIEELIDKVIMMKTTKPPVKKVERGKSRIVK